MIIQPNALKAVAEAIDETIDRDGGGAYFAAEQAILAYRKSEEMVVFIKAASEFARFLEKTANHSGLLKISSEQETVAVGYQERFKKFHAALKSFAENLNE